MNSIHIIAQGKGGVGKTIISAMLAHYFKDKGLPVTCIDTDAVNQTFSLYKSLKPQNINLFQEEQVDAAAFDSVIEQMVTTENNFVVDNGASSFVPLAEYITENQIIDLLNDHGKVVYFHIPVTGGPAQLDTLSGMRGLISSLSQNANFVIWENRFFGDIHEGGKSFKDMSVYQQTAERIDQVISFGQNKKFFLSDFSKMHKEKLSFDEAISSGKFPIMSKQRLKMLQREIYVQLDDAFKPLGLEEDQQ